MLIGGLQKTTLIDYPGKIACTVFTLGCNFRCHFCSNPELVLPSKIKKQPRIPEKAFFEFLKNKKGLLDGVVVCGGEPTLYRDLPRFLKKIKSMGFLVKLDTNGTNPGMLKGLIKQKLVDYVAMDIKHKFKMQNAKCKITTQNSKISSKAEDFSPKARKLNSYNRVTGVKVDLAKIKNSIEIIKNSGIDYEFRSTVVPGIHSKEDILQIAREIAPARAYFLQNFQPGKTLDLKLVKTKSFAKDFLLEVIKEIAPLFEICQAR